MISLSTAFYVSLQQFQDPFLEGTILPEGVTSSTVSSALGLTILFLLASLVMLLFIFLFRRALAPYKILFGLAIFSGLSIVSASFLDEPWAFLSALLATLLMFWYPVIWLSNIVLALALGGVAAFFGVQFSLISLILFAALIAVYDVIAVYKTKHMVKMARVLLTKRAAFAFYIPSRAHDMLGRLDLKKVKFGRDVHIIGGGDVAIPAMVISAMVGESIGGAVWMGIAVLAGLALTNRLFFSQKKYKPMPALPPVVLSLIIGYALYALVGVIYSPGA